MAVMKSFTCRKHGTFDAFADGAVRCPAARCRCKVKEELSAPSLLSWGTKHADKTLKGLAADFKMTDIKSTREGEAQTGYLTRNNAPVPKEAREPRPGDAAIWGNRSGMDMATVMRGGAFRSVRGEQVGVKPSDQGITRGPAPDPRATFRDHENLKISK